jgi:hypothetical protein
MSASQAQALSAIAFQLAAALQAYEEEVDSMVAAPLDAEQYQRVSQRMDEMRMYATAFPALSVAWVELMIRHFELMHGLWRTQQDRGATNLRALQAQLTEAVSRLSRKCVQLMPSA